MYSHLSRLLSIVPECDCPPYLSGLRSHCTLHSAHEHTFIITIRLLWSKHKQSDLSQHNGIHRNVQFVAYQVCLTSCAPCTDRSIYEIIVIREQYESKQLIMLLNHPRIFYHKADNTHSVALCFTNLISGVVFATVTCLHVRCVSDVFFTVTAESQVGI